MSTYRIEEDCLGQIKVEADKYWKSQTQRSLENFKIGQELMPASLIHSFAILKEACAKANLHFHKITEKQCEAIVEICQRIEDGQYLDQFPLHVWQTGSGTQTNMNANEVISMLGNELANENIVHPNDTVNASQSSNDTFPTAMHIAAYKKVVEHTLPSVEKLRNTLHEKAESFKSVVKMSSTSPSCFSLTIAGPFDDAQIFILFLDKNHKTAATKHTIMIIHIICLKASLAKSRSSLYKSLSIHESDCFSFFDWRLSILCILLS